MSWDTLEKSEDLRAFTSAPVTPGLALVFTAGKPATTVIPLGDHGELTLERDHALFASQPDGRMSRRHALVRFDGRRFLLTDLGSRNGSWADGAPVVPEMPREVTRVLRVGDSLLIPLRDVTALQRLGVRVAGGRVEGPALLEALRVAAQAASSGTILHITGESGAGKEGLARTFHEHGPHRAGPFQAVNCATIPEGLAERLLFGAKRGAFSGADADADGYVQAAHGGTLFLDEVAELSLPVQAKLLRVLETSEVLPLGAARPRKIELRFCSATHRDLRAQVAAGTLREDLYFRISTPRVVAPPLRERREELAWLIAGEVARIAPALAIHASLVETCLLRPWPGNVRELCAEIRGAAQAALAAEATRVEARHLGETAGTAFTAAPRAADPSGAASSVAPPTRSQLTAVLRRAAGNVSAAARELGVHRTQLRRWLERHALDARDFAPAGATDESGED